MARINITNPDAFAKQYPHLVRTVTTIEPDKRKITSAIKDGWKLEHIEVLEGPEEEGAPVVHEKQGTEAERPPAAAPATPAPEQEGKPTERTLGEVMGILQTTPALGKPAIPPSFPRWPGESERDYHERYNLTERLRAHEERAKMNKSPA